MRLVALEQLRHRWRRALSLLLTVIVATASFVLLTGTAETSRLAVRGEVSANFRSTYDLLIRPVGSRSALEVSDGLLRPNYQSGIFGGITTEQLRTIRGVAGVEVAAPTGNIGYVDLGGWLDIDLKRLLTSGRQQLFRVTPRWSMDNGATLFNGAPLYLYYSTNATVSVSAGSSQRPDNGVAETETVGERIPGGRTLTVCRNVASDQAASLLAAGGAASPFGDLDPNRVPFRCVLTKAGTGLMTDPSISDGSGGVKVSVPLTFPVLVAAVDPDAENALSGLGAAMSTGRALAAGDGPTPTEYGDSIPAVSSSTAFVSTSVSATVARVSPGSSTFDTVLGSSEGVVGRLARLPADRVSASGPYTARDAFTTVLGNSVGSVGTLRRVGSTSYTGQGALQVVPVKNPEDAYGADGPGASVPIGGVDPAVRSVSSYAFQNAGTNQPPLLTVVGTYDPTKLAGNSDLSGLASSDFRSTRLVGADAEARAALHDEPWQASSNLGGYPAQPPTLLTTFAGADKLLRSSEYGLPKAAADAPISVVRVKVAGVTGTDAASRERLNQAATDIAARTGLLVDIVAGASGQAVTIVVPAGEHGRPQLQVLEQWARQGVAYEVIDAVDRKSMALFVLILGVCAAVVTNAAAASVRSRRRQLGTLSALGWDRSRLFGLIELELLSVGAVAGALGAVIAWAVGAASGMAVASWQLGLAVPVAMGLMGVAGLMPSWRAARSTPMAAIRPQVWRTRRARDVRTTWGLSLQALTRSPGRSVLAMLSLALGVGGAVFLAGVQQAFVGTVVGSMLGDAVAVQVRTPDVIAIGMVLALAAVGVGDVLYLAAEEQRGELAILRATGWAPSAIRTLVMRQGVLLGAAGGVLGAVLGVVGFGLFTDAWTPIVPIALAGAGLGTLLGLLAAAIPAALIGRLPLTRLLSEDE